MLDKDVVPVLQPSDAQVARAASCTERRTFPESARHSCPSCLMASLERLERTAAHSVCKLKINNKRNELGLAWTRIFRPASALPPRASLARVPKRSVGVYFNDMAELISHIFFGDCVSSCQGNMRASAAKIFFFFKKETEQDIKYVT